MRSIASLERFLERLFERPGARLPGGRPQPAVLARRLERAIDAARRNGSDGAEAPSRLEVRLRPEDLAALAPDSAAADALEEELARSVLAYARRRRYGLRERPVVILVADAALPPAGMDIRTRFSRPTAMPVDAALPPIERTSVHLTLPGVRVGLRISEPGQSQRSIDLGGSPLAIGRAGDNDLVLADGRVSRHHARIAGRGGRLVLADLGSRNGSFVNGKRVTEIALGEGDRITLGMTALEVVALAGDEAPPVAVAPADGPPGVA